MMSGKIMSEYKITKAASYTANISMSVIGTLSPLLFSTFYEKYAISFGLLGLLVFVNFFTQLIVDLVFSFYSHKFDIAATVRIMPLLTIAGLGVYALIPMFFPQAAYAGLVAGTVIFAASSGLSEVLISPIIAAIPSDNPQREMSKLHSVYAWGVVGVVIVSSVILNFAGKDNWYWLVIGWMIVPVVSEILFMRAKIPPMATPEKTSKAVGLFSSKTLVLCVLCIFFGGASECTMSQWSSGYIEQALNVPKVWGDVFGVAMFALTLGLGRTLYAMKGKNIYAVLIAGSVGAVVCYLVASLTPVPVLGLIACALTGLCTSMLWPGSLIAVSDNFPKANVAVFALMAAGGDMGGALGPQITGLIADAVIANPDAVQFADKLGMSAEQLGMKAGILCCVIFPLLATLFFVLIYADKKKRMKKAVLASDGVSEKSDDTNI